jgi:hypothetical protein
MRFVSPLLLLLVIASPVAAQAAIDRAAWLAGCWEAKAGPRVVTEIWMNPAGGLMIGGSRTVNNGVLREFEHLRIRAQGDTLVYTALPSGQKTTDFAGVPGDGVLTFENPQHDFPTRLIYRRLSADSITARVEGPGKDGGMRGFDVPMKRVSCS